MTLYFDRKVAGRLLGEQVRDHVQLFDPLVLALPRGGVPVAAEVAEVLGAPLDLLLVRKIGAPGREELAVGAIALAGGEVVRTLNRGIVEELGLAPEAVDRATERSRMELERRDRLYRGDLPAPTIANRAVIVVDDGLATGATMRAAVLALRQLQPATITVAVPAAPRQSIDQLTAYTDAVVCPATPEPFHAVGLWYDDFSQVDDETVRELLRRHRAARATAEPRAAT